MSRRFFTPEEVRFLKRNFVKYGADYCSQKLGRNPPYVAKKAYSLGLKRKSSDQWRIDKSPKQVDMVPFYTIALPEVAYALGFIWADGNVSKSNNRVAIEIQGKDGNDLASAIRNVLPFHVHISHRNQQYIFYINDYMLHTFLVENDYLIKSYASPSKILSKIPLRLHHYFFRGYFDGDGCFTNKSNCCVSFTGSYEQDWSDVEIFLRNLSISPKIIRRTDSKLGYRSSFIYVYGKEKCGKILREIYKEKQLGLTRKSQLFHEFITNP